MSGTDLKQRLVAILAADAAGYSRLMSLDERSTVTALDASRSVFHTRTVANQGRVVDTAGDSVLAVFETAAGALNAALQIQAQLAEAEKDIPLERRMQFRIGIHSGDVMEKADGSVYGDGVNIAARLQALAEPGQITVSDAIHGAVRGKVAATFTDQGEQQVKNIAHPVRAYRVRVGHANEPTTVSVANPLAGAIDLSLPDKPSIAVLPFTNMSGDPEQEYFTDGITEDIVTELSRFHSLFVIARNSSFTYKGKPVDVRTVSRELGVRYVLEGSIRRSGNRIRVTAQLIDALSGNHIWAEKYDRVLEDIFAVQEEVTECIVAAIAPQIDSSERAGATRRRPANLSAYELALRATSLCIEGSDRSDPATLEEALRQARCALAIDPESLHALHAVARVQVVNLVFSFAPDRAGAWNDGMAAAARAIALANSSMVRSTKALLLLYAPGGGRWDEARIEAETAYRTNPQDVFALLTFGHITTICGDAPAAIRLLERWLRIDPRDPLAHRGYQMLALAYWLAKDYPRALQWAMRAAADAPGYALTHGCTVLAHVGLGALDQAKSALELTQRLSPGLVQRWLQGGAAIADETARQRLTTFMRVAAGLEDPSAADALR